MLQSLITVAAAAAYVILSTAVPAHADADDAKWVAACVKDNKDEGQAVDVITKYCTCMNSKMSSNETRSITQWEKANKPEMEACSAEAGWKGKS